MNVIFFSRREGRARHLNLAQPLTLAIVVLLGVSVFAGVFAVGEQFGEHNMARLSLLRPAAAFRAEQAQISQLRSQMQDKVDALAMRLGLLDANIIRLNALGKRLTQMAKINSSEFDFDHDPAVGGPEDSGSVHVAAMSGLTGMIDDLSQTIDRRSAQFNALANVMLGRQLSAEIRPSGRPVQNGYISSGFGERMDPFTGEEGVHKGVDFAAPAGTRVLAVAAGVVTWAGPREGYGNLVEVAHGKGYSTRYAHNSVILVKVGDEVQRGEPIAEVGSTGRSTGPHVHFEVLKGGVQVNPMSFVQH
ncbi:MAG TPA: M23 family metallopeptidase [Steroidobacteraceae bacterium]|nr:M23 family metallopeptidase [Steroidobacteraceae bacterium]